MKPNNYLVFARGVCILVLLLFCLNCSKENAPITTTPPPPPPGPATCSSCQLLYYSGEYANAPSLDPGRYEAAVRFTPAKIGNLVGKSIKEIRFFVLDKPDSIKVKLYGPLNATKPGSLLYSADVTSFSERFKWNVHTLTKEISLKEEDIWVSIEFKIQNTGRTIGGDAGPALPDGDWLYSSSDLNWTPFVVRGGANINWTIQLNVLL